MWFKKIIFILLCSFSTLIFAANNITLHDAEGHAITRADLKNKWVILNYWADWCDACIEEMPELNLFYEKNTNKNLLLLGANYDQLPLASLKQAINKTAVFFPVLVEDPNLVWQLDQIDVIPITFIINPHGVVVKKIVGPSTAESLSAIMQQLMS